MKNRLNKIALLSLVLACFMSCETDVIDTYSGKDNIYFTYAETAVNWGRGLELRDSIGYSFAFKKPEVQSMVVNIPLAVQGTVSTQDREVKVVIDAGSTAKEGVHFEIPKQTLLRAGMAVDSIPVTFIRTPEMENQSFSLILHLEPNNRFSTDFDKMVTENGTLSLIELEITISDILNKPMRWFDYYLGNFTAKKLFLMSELLDFDPIIFSQSPDLALQLYFATFMQRYLNTQEASGNIIYEDDGSKMIMGLGVQ